jgi:Zn-dependent protease with chaperone function
VGIVLGGLTLWLPYLLLRKSPNRWWLWTGLLAVPVVFGLVFIQPVFVDPLFNEFGPMKDKALEAKILALAERAGIEGGRVFEVAKSEDTLAVNAYVTGFMGTKRIVLWDTIIQKLDERQLLFVMGHELGHYALGHVWRGVLLACAGILVVLYVAHRFSRGLIARFGSRFGFTELGDMASLPLILLIASVLSFASAPFVLAYSRWQEREADRFGLEITRDNWAGASAFVRLQEENLGNPRPPLWHKILRATHPPLGERIDFCNDYRPWESGDPRAYEPRFR